MPHRRSHAAACWFRALMLFAITAGTACATSVFAQAVAPVTVVRAQSTGAAASLPLTGTVTSERSAALSPRVSGLVLAVHVDAGDRARRGAVLLQLDPALAELALQRAQAALREAEAQLGEAQRQYAETKELVERRLVPQTRLPAAEAQMRVAAAAVERLKAEQRQQAEIVKRHTVVAPFSGVVSRKLAEVGEWVETGNPVLELVDTQRLRIDVQVPQEHAASVRDGAPVTVTLDALPGQELDGKVSAKVPVKDPTARTFLVRVEVANAAKFMTPGMSARVEFELRRSESTVSVPRDALVRRPDGSNSVWVVSVSGDIATVSERRVEVGRTLAESVEVRAGLEPEALVVLRGNEILKEGQQVRILEAAN